jgi:hypothetical protein
LNILKAWKKLRYGLLVAGGLGTAAVVYGSAAGHEGLYKSVLMPAVRLVDPEQAHVLAVKLAAWGMVPRDKSVPDKILVSKTYQMLLFPVLRSKCIDIVMWNKVVESVCRIRDYFTKKLIYRTRSWSRSAGFVITLLKNLYIEQSRGVGLQDSRLLY